MISELAAHVAYSIPERWKTQPKSVLADHHACQQCRKARAWFRMLAVSHRRESTFPLWIAERWQWGPSRWPYFWCELPYDSELDCGVRAHLATEALLTCGVRALQAQVALRLTSVVLDEYRSRWERHKSCTDWIEQGLAYHEAVAVLDHSSRTVDLWDPDTNSLLDVRAGQVYRGVVGLRIPDIEEGAWTWQGVHISSNAWQLTDGDITRMTCEA